MVEINVLPKVGTNNGVATHLEIVKRYSKYTVVNWAGKGRGVVNIQAIGNLHPKIDVFTAHSYYADEQAKTKFGANANKRLIHNAKQASRVICVSKYVQNYLVKSGVNRFKTVVIENPVDLKEIDAVKPTARKLPKKFSLFMGDKGVKRPKLFIELAKAFPKENFVAIGLPSNLKAPKNVLVLPKLPRSQVLSIMKCCNIFLLLSKRESCPYALLEAMAMKKTCIASNYAGQAEIIQHGKNGFLFKPDNPISLKNVFRAYKNSSNLKERKEARLTVERKYNARIQVPKIDSVYVPPTVSIITYVYCTSGNKRFKQLLEAIASVKNQGFRFYEHIIVDDGSTIDLHNKLTNPNIRYYWKRNTGITKTTETFNLGFIKAQGKYCIILPSDDLHMGNTLSRLSTYLNKHPKTVAVVGNYIDQRFRKGKLRKETKVIRHEKSIKNQLLHDNCVNAVGCMFRRSALAKIDMPPNDTGFAADYDLWMKLSEVGRFERIPDCVIKYRCFSNATRFQTQKNMKYRTGCVDKVLFRAKKRRGIR